MLCPSSLDNAPGTRRPFPPLSQRLSAQTAVQTLQQTQQPLLVISSPRLVPTVGQVCHPLAHSARQIHGLLQRSTQDVVLLPQVVRRGDVLLVPSSKLDELAILLGEVAHLIHELSLYFPFQSSTTSPIVPEADSDRTSAFAIFPILS